MSDLNELYQQVIIDHNANPHNFGKLDGATNTAKGNNPLCGDHFTVELILDNDRIKEIRFSGSGCAISKASASIMTTLIKGKTKKFALEIFQKFHDFLIDHKDLPDKEIFGKLKIFAGVKEFPMRVKCVSLAWHAMKAAIENEGKLINFKSVKKF